VDAKRLHSVVGDEGRIIPKKIQKALLSALADENTGWLVVMFHALQLHVYCC